MDKNFLTQITNELYRLTLLFPKKEPLRYKMRELADTILANFLAEAGPPPTELEVMDGYFEVAKKQNWVKKSEILNLQKEYSKLKEFSGKPKIKNDNPIVIPPQLFQEPVFGASSRQEKILAVLKEKGRAQVWEIKQIFPQVSKRTLRRDFESLFKKGIVERIGERNDTFYRLSA